MSRSVNWLRQRKWQPISQAQQLLLLFATSLGQMEQLWPRMASHLQTKEPWRNNMFLPYGQGSKRKPVGITGFVPFFRLPIGFLGVPGIFDPRAFFFFSINRVVLATLAWATWGWTYLLRENWKPSESSEVHVASVLSYGSKTTTSFGTSATDYSKSLLFTQNRKNWEKPTALVAFLCFYPSKKYPS